MREGVRTFGFSERFVARRRHLMTVLAATIAVLVLLGSLARVNFHFNNIGYLAGPFLVVVMISVIFALQTRYIIRRCRQMKLHFSPDGLVREAGTARQEVAWGSITKVRFRQKLWGEADAIEVFTVNGRPLLLVGFECMSEIVELIRNGVPAEARIETRRQRRDWENPLVMVPAIVAISLAFEGVRRLGGKMVIPLSQLALGVFFLTCAPLSRTNPKFRTLELTLGVLALVLAAGMLFFKVGL